MRSFKVDVDHPRQIKAAKRYGEEHLEEGPVAVLMNHSHESIVRGNRERIKGLESEVEISRTDGGSSYYHSDESRCLHLKLPEKYDKRHRELIKRWGGSIVWELEQLGFEAKYRKGDVYDSEGNQLVGLSADTSGEYTDLRACWYEDEPEIEHLLEADGEEEVMDRIRPAYGLFERLEEKYKPEQGKELPRFVGPYESGDVDPRPCP